jgi:prepilin-type N-terminal cleavage/methylation domain-containing protein
MIHVDTARRTAFTLVELLVVIAIIGIRNTSAI